jgi:hypothetical protein
VNRLEKYVIVTDIHTLGLATRVERRLAEGWEPVGGVVVFREASNIYYLQTMVKRLPTL